MPTHVYAKLLLLFVQPFASIFQIIYTTHTILPFPFQPYFDPFISHKFLEPMHTPIFDPLLTQNFRTVNSIIFPMLISRFTATTVIFQ